LRRVEHGDKYLDDVEAREDGGTPGFMHAMRTALCVRLKEAMGVEKILAREHELLGRVWDRLAAIPSVHLLVEQGSTVYTIRATTNSTDWINAGTATADPNGNFSFTDPNAANFTYRFYRTSN
jgi:selenocysteine lyase/cysteine desulfurase